jgi:predicted methyltransferase MtxX (methanogen marker protein 4)
MQEFSATSICRIALLESAANQPFWFAPVGIDEGITYASRREFIENAIGLLEKCRVTPNIGILSKGRTGDSKRGAFIKESLDDNQRLVEEMAHRYPSIMIAHDEILLENVVSKQRNFILAPDGVSGNLIYRTLVHLGQGKAYGAVYLGKSLEQYSIIDTSRVGNVKEIEGAMILALVF